MKIESIKRGKRDADKLVIKTVDGAYISARIDDAYKLSVGDEISEAEAARLNAAYAKQKTRASAARSLSHHSMSKRDLEKKLISRGFSEEETSETAAWFEERGVLDDGKYSRELAEYYKRRGFGERKIREELSRHGIPRELIEETLAALGSTERELFALIEKKLCGKSLEDDCTRRKLVAFLTRRGFKFDEIRNALKQFQVELEDID